MTPPVLAPAPYFPTWLDGSDTTRMAWAAHIYIVHGGFGARSWTSHAAIILNMEAGWECQGTDSALACRTPMASTRAGMELQNLPADTVPRSRTTTGISMAPPLEWLDAGKR